MKTKYYQIIIIVCGMISVSLGLCMNIAGLFFTPLSNSLNSTISTLSLSSTLTTICIASTGILAQKLIKNKNGKIVIYIAEIVSIITPIFLSISKNIISFYIFSIIRGIAAGFICLVTVTYIINNWFISKNGTITGIVMAFSGITGAIVSPIISTIIENYNYHYAYYFLSMLTFILLLPSFIFNYSLNPLDMSYSPYLKNKDDYKEKKYSSKEIKVSTWTILITISLISSGLSGLVQHFSGLGNQIYGTYTTGSLMVSMAMCGNILSKLLIGILIDKSDGKVAYCLASIIALMGSILILSSKNNILLVVAAFLYGFIYAAGTICLSQLTKEEVGTDNYGKIYPYVSFSATLGTAIIVSLLGLFHDYYNNYYPGIVFSIILQLAILIFTFITIKKR